MEQGFLIYEPAEGFGLTMFQLACDGIDITLNISAAIVVCMLRYLLTSPVSGDIIE
jgi:hypothetical protein